MNRRKDTLYKNRLSEFKQKDDCFSSMLEDHKTKQRINNTEVSLIYKMFVKIPFYTQKGQDNQ